MTISLSISGLSDVGMLRRRNEDSFAVQADLGVAVVADGMGGHPGGDVASRVAAETAAAALGVHASQGIPVEAEGLRGAMADVVRSAHEAIRARGAEEPELEGMGTTLTAMLVDAESGSYVIGHVGDSRAYLFRDGHVSQLTRDDTWVQEQMDKGALTSENARNSPYGHLLTQCLGLDESPAPQLVVGRAGTGDVFLLCTDGLVGILPDDRIAEILSSHLGPLGSASSPTESALEALVSAANEAGGPDNITAALVVAHE